MNTLVGRAIRLVAAIGLAINGYVHYDQYQAGLKFVDTIKDLFVMNMIIAGVLAIALAVLSDRWSALAGLVFSAGTFVAFLIARYSELFGYSESEWRTSTIVAAIAEVGTSVILTPYVIGRFLPWSRLGSPGVAADHVA